MNPGLNLHIYPSAMENESRIFRLSQSLQQTGAFRETHVVGIAHHELSANVEMDDGRRIIRLGTAPAGRGKFWRAGEALAWHRRVYSSYRRRDVSLINAHSVWVLPVCWLLARRVGAGLVYSTHELETETPSMRGTKRLLAKGIEVTLIRRCDLVSCVNDSIASWYHNRYRIPKPFVVRNIPIVGAGAPIDLKNILAVPAGAMLFIHTGRITTGRSIPQILNAFKVAETSSHVVFLGDGPLLPEILAASETCDRIHWLAPVAHDQVVRYVAAADVALCLIDVSTESYRLSSPNKLFEALSAGTPPLCTELPEAQALLAGNFEDWRLVNPGTDLVGAVKRITPDLVARFRQTWPGLGTWESEVREFQLVGVRLAGTTAVGADAATS